MHRVFPLFNETYSFRELLLGLVLSTTAQPHFWNKKSLTFSMHLVFRPRISCEIISKFVLLKCRETNVDLPLPGDPTNIIRL
jgi:hypothetical protein